MFGDFSRFRCVLVTGPHRSGTTICARMVAEDTGFCYVDEEECTDRQAWDRLARTGRGIVMQCPGMARWVHEVAGRDVMVVWMRRPTSQILRSEARIDWKDAAERAKYADLPGYMRQLPICVTKYSYWLAVQRPLVLHYQEVQYSDLQQHRLWVSEELRRTFAPRQWSLALVEA